MRQVREYCPCYFQPAWKGGKKNYIDRNTKRPLSAGSWLQQHFDTGRITRHRIKLLDPQVQQHFINYARRLNMQAYWLSGEHSVCSVVFVYSYQRITEYCWCICLCENINHEISKGKFDKSIVKGALFWTDCTFCCRDGIKIVQFSPPLACIHLEYAASLK